MDYSMVIVLAMAIVSGIFGILGFIMGMMAVSRVYAIEKSTHTITYQPIDAEVDKANEEFLKKRGEWATQPESIAKQEELYREDIEEEMPQFALEDEDKEIFSF